MFRGSDDIGGERIKGMTSFGVLEMADSLELSFDNIKVIKEVGLDTEMNMVVVIHDRNLNGSTFEDMRKSLFDLFDDVESIPLFGYVEVDTLRHLSLRSSEKYKVIYERN